MRARGLPLHVTGSGLQLPRRALAVPSLELTTVGAALTLGGPGVHAVGLGLRVLRFGRTAARLRVRTIGLARRATCLGVAVPGLGLRVAGRTIAVGGLTRSARGIHIRLA